ncbi:MAG: SOS response-associated peptidase [Actinomycetota bacterium]|jgi:putative SOS response-associated peptidase YedK|nr:SOS response-associated peptidase [Actinomycetota bacterium]MDA3014107.1 SOS response-associated peptidase [Actinomycetota bacterium]MDA3028745.1 SOS response-associated peptidase [Actinomycetota bacterium]
MCGRVVQTTPIDELAQILNVGSIDESIGQFMPKRNIAPSADLVIEETDGAENVLTRRRWGLVPHWANDPTIGAKLSNARSETVWDRPSFRDAVRRRRCIVPVDGFYEWAPASPDGPTTAAGRPAKRPHLFKAADGSPLLLAGIAADWHHNDGGGSLRTVCLLTTSANQVMAPIHDRMPVVVSRSMTEVWLHAEPREARDLLDHLLRPAPDDELVEHEVSTAVNDARNESADLTDPVDTTPNTLW